LNWDGFEAVLLTGLLYGFLIRSNMRLSESAEFRIRVGLLVAVTYLVLHYLHW
jgi:hypothetical protein